MLINCNIVVLFVLFFMVSVIVFELFIGVGVVYNELFYCGYNENMKVILLISYEGDIFYVCQIMLGFILL